MVDNLQEDLRGGMTMLDVLSSIVEAISTLLNFVVSFFSGILSVFGLVAQCGTFLTLAWMQLPSVLLVFCVAGLSIVIVFQLIGR